MEKLIKNNFHMPGIDLSPGVDRFTQCPSLALLSHLELIETRLCWRQILSDKTVWQFGNDYSHRTPRRLIFDICDVLVTQRLLLLSRRSSKYWLMNQMKAWGRGQRERCHLPSCVAHLFVYACPPTLFDSVTVC